jgi:hypothetical protein
MLKKGVPELGLVLVCLVVSLVVFAKARTAFTPASNGQSGQSLAATTPTQPATEPVLEAQLETMRGYDERLLATVYWSLGGVFLLVVLVGGINWFTNYRLYERERESLREASKLAAQEEAAKLRTTFDDMRQQSSKEAHQLHEEIATFQSQIRDMVEAKYARVSKEIKEAAASTREGALRAIAEAEYDNTQLRARYALKINSYESLQAWKDHLIALKTLGRMRDEFFVGHAIEGIEACLQENAIISFGLEAEIVKLLEHAPQTLAGRIGHVKHLMSSARHIN